MLQFFICYPKRVWKTFHKLTHILDKCTNICYNGRSPFNKKGQSTMNKFYTINYKLFVSRKGDETLLDAQTSDFGYRSRENAYKAVQERIKMHIETGDYKHTRSSFVIETDTSETSIKFRIEFEIKEVYLSDFEKES